jgi:hypothetical protein
MTAHLKESAALSGPFSSIDQFWSAASKGVIQTIVEEQRRIEQVALQGTSVDFQKQLLSFKLAQLVNSGALSEQAARRLYARIVGEALPVSAHDKVSKTPPSKLEELIEKSLSITSPEGKTGPVTTGLATIGGAVIGLVVSGGNPAGAVIGAALAIGAATAEV